MVNLPPDGPPQFGVPAAASTPEPGTGPDPEVMKVSWIGTGAAEAGEAAEVLSTPFEEWCAARGIHPDAIGAWECFEASSPVTLVEPA
ncbi:hypothetical protein GCM10009844_05050 [Nocardioides koreensis]|uniref:GyrI-like small molecule binding domain-containing protein n=2 Tax=Nocardioides koreensis TaxID=433651 RepID=A0ABP5KYJ9_9ACTN